MSNFMSTTLTQVQFLVHLGSNAYTFYTHVVLSYTHTMGDLVKFLQHHNTYTFYPHFVLCHTHTALVS